MSIPLNSTDHNTASCRTLVTHLHLEIKQLTTTLCMWSFNQFVMHCTVHLPNPYVSSLQRRTLCLLIHTYKSTGICLVCYRNESNFGAVFMTTMNKYFTTSGYLYAAEQNVRYLNASKKVLNYQNWDTDHATHSNKNPYSLKAFKEIFYYQCKFIFYSVLHLTRTGNGSIMRKVTNVVGISLERRDAGYILGTRSKTPFPFSWKWTMSATRCGFTLA